MNYFLLFIWLVEDEGLEVSIDLLISLVEGRWIF